ncbi:hypothetical protein N8E86_04610 [Avibacterium paragallinarum]|uniref:hypothetical protein n=1 Tax=Avibacterium paragallinarum TaxID=728 RepID=UPI0021F765DE|nr:hypothetical protein [Avibacterium paragallinarum]UXN35487.1 hypothetical protein N8E86_04610 [Avibacterium paragallinarum]
MKKILSLLALSLCITSYVSADEWPPENETPEKAAIFLEKTYEHPEKVKVGVTLFISGWNHNKKMWNEPFKYGKIAAIQKNKAVDGKKCDAFTIDPSKKTSWRCLERLLLIPQNYNGAYNTYYVRFDDPALNDGKPFKPAEIKDEFDDFIKE